MTIKIQQRYLFGLIKGRETRIEPGQRVSLGDGDPRLWVEPLDEDRIKVIVSEWRRGRDGKTREHEVARGFLAREKINSERVGMGFVSRKEVRWDSESDFSSARRK